MSKMVFLSAYIMTTLSLTISNSYNFNDINVDEFKFELNYSEFTNIYKPDTVDIVNGFNNTIPFVLKHEGEAYVHDTSINEVSRRGITLRTYRQYYGKGNNSSIRNITVKQATDIYKSLFWDANNLDSIYNIGFKKTATVLMDSEVNLGPSRANKFLQGILGANKTGVIDTQTLGRLRSTTLTDDAIQSKLVKKRRNYYSRLIKKRNVFAKYQNGWNKRLDAISEYVKEI